MSIREIKTSIVSAGLILVLGLLMLVSATYAWLSVSRIPFISDVTLSVITDNDLKIAPDNGGEPGEWAAYLDASEEFQYKAPLKPVTYMDGDFYKLTYDEEGRTAGVIPITEEDINVQTYNGELSSVASLAAEDSGCLLRLDFWLKTDGSPTTVGLKDPIEIGDGEISRGTFAVGMPQWDAQEKKHINAAYGSETTLRMGFEIWPTDEDGELMNESTFFVYEPNADIHPDGTTGYIETVGLGEGGKYIDEEHHYIQDASTWTDKRPADEEELEFSAGNFTQSMDMFSLNGKDMAKVRLWIWVEGQDYDCYALSYADAVEILCNIEFGVSESGRETGVERR